MGGTSIGGKKSALKCKEKYGEDFFSKIGAKGGRVYHPETRMFRADHKLAIEAGRKGGTKSRRTGIKNKKEKS